ncbi:10843_t:CDS:2 [Diversispora eburnea]|uniref:10843_t:CDS:1 n=1 Tax=Diversispora eburnea TaxID=1213867 RepID=A0A9N8WI46_9GLOM|nr:10843_t:CDS:2 [Diversispora eburnea]
MGLCNSKQSARRPSKPPFNSADSKDSQSSKRRMLNKDGRSNTYNSQLSSINSRNSHKISNNNGNNKNNTNINNNNINDNNNNKNDDKINSIIFDSPITPITKDKSIRRNSKKHKNNKDQPNDCNFNDFENKEEHYVDIYELEHVLLENIWNSLFSSPIEEDLLIGHLNYVLDVACGPGYWICDMAIKFPKSQFIGIQAFPIMKKPQLPYNANFVRIDILNGIFYGSESFNFVHLRILSPKYSEVEWKFIIDHMIRVTKPGGYCEIEVGDYISFENEGPLLKEINIIHQECLKVNGVKISIASELENIMKNTNKFSKLNKESRKIPMGRSTGKFGEMASNHFIQTLNSQGENISSYLGQTLKEYDDKMVKVISELDEFKSTCFNCIRVFGKKIEKNE